MMHDAAHNNTLTKWRHMKAKTKDTLTSMSTKRTSV